MLRKTVELVPVLQVIGSKRVPRPVSRSNAESRRLTLRKWHDLAAKLVQIQGLQRGDLGGRLKVQHAAIDGRCVLAVGKAAGPSGDARRRRRRADGGTRDSFIELDAAGASLIRV